MNNNPTGLAQTLIHNDPMVFLNRHLVRQIDEALGKVGDFGEVRLVVVKGRLRFIQIVRSETVDNAGGVA